jgi:class 3 adenylate cyclase
MVAAVVTGDAKAVVAVMGAVVMAVFAAPTADPAAVAAAGAATKPLAGQPG